jgi:hypothetical protein
MVVCNTKVLVSGYQSIDMHGTGVPVNFDGKLLISILRKKQIFTKKEGQKYTFSKTFRAPPFGKRTDDLA